MTLKTTKKYRNKLLFQAEADAKAGERTLLRESEIQDLIHDADRAEELEKELAAQDENVLAAMNQIHVMDKELSDLRAKLKYYEDALYSTEQNFVCVDHGVYATPISSERVVDILRERDDLRAKLDIAEAIITRAFKEQGEPKQRVHPSHETRPSDASTFEEVCVHCGKTDKTGGGWGGLAEPCTVMKEQEK